MAFQSTVVAQMGFGVVGELAIEGPLLAQPARIVSGDAANNVVGRAFTVTSGGTGSWDGTSADAGDPAPLVAAAGGTNPFAGILANPKVYPGLGTQAGGTLAPTLTLPNNQMAELVLETGGIIVTLAAAANVGDVVYFANATGILATTAPGAAAPANHQGPIGRVERYSNAGAGLAVISVFPPRIPAGA